MSRVLRSMGGVSGIAEALILLLTLCSTARAYEGAAHSTLTGDAFDRSVLADAQGGPLALLGLDDPLNRTYRSTGVDPGFASGSAREIVSFGARFEDLPNSDFRFLKHFFDPQNGGRGLTTAIGGANLPSPDWELEDRGSVGSQSFSLHDALDFYYLALVSPDASAREGYLVLLLEALGRGVHHLQDMAQPAHTRNDPHPLGLDGDLYEQATDDLASPNSSDFPQGIVYPTEAVDLHTFDTARKFWENGGMGLAEFTAQNFLSQDTNFATIGSGLMTDEEFPLPAPVPCEGQALVTQKKISELDLHPKSFSLPGTMWFIGTPVHDHYLSGDETTLCNPRTSAYSLFDFDLAAIGRPMRFQLNRYTWAATREVLLPRAIAYSAGLINYFFRGALTLDVTEDAASLTLDIRNRSAGEFSLADGSRTTTPAEFEVWYDAADGTRKAAQVSDGRDLQGASVAFDGQHSIRFVRPQDVSQSKALPYMLVFRGTIGTEEGIIGVAFGPRSAAFAITADQPVDGVAGAREIDHTNQSWKLVVEPARAGNVDWRGSTPGDLLTWSGPQSRYFFSEGQVDNLSPAIYSGGTVLANAPAGVLGAALRRVGSGPAELLAVTYAAGQLQVAVRALSADAGGAPQWRSIYSGSTAVPSSPAFANGSGTEFQWLTAEGQRMKLKVAGSEVTLEQGSARGRATQTGQYSSHTESAVCGQNTVSDESYQVRWSTPTVMCIDYAGDTEVLCQIDSDPALSQHETDHEQLANNIEGKQLSLDETTSSARFMMVGSTRIPLTGSTTVTHAAIDDAYHPFDDDPPQISEHQTTQVREYDARFLYLDARNAIAAFVETDTVRDTVSDLSGAVHADNAGYLSVGTLTNSTHIESRMVVLHDGETETLSTTSLPPSVTRTAAQTPIVNEFCPSVPTGDSGGSFAETVLDDSGLDVTGFVHPLALQGSPAEGFAVDGAGDLAASVPVISLDSTGEEQVGDPWNFLSGGSLSALLPSSSPSPHYFPIGAIR